MGPLSYCLTIFRLLSFLSLFLAKAVRCQDPPEVTFNWGFSDETFESSPSLPACQSFDITIVPLDSNNVTPRTPPFYMNSIALGGTPRTTAIGTNENSLSWTLDHPIGTELILQVVDAKGSSGGIAPLKYTVVNGEKSSCIVNEQNSNDFTISSNLNGPDLTNVTMPADADAYTYINHGTLPWMLAAAVSDATGKWASGTPSIAPLNSSGTDCGGLVSSSGNATELDQPTGSATPGSNDERDSQKQTTIAAGVTVPVGVLLIAGLLGCLYWRRRTQDREKDSSPAPNTHEPDISVKSAQTLNTPSFGYPGGRNTVMSGSASSAASYNLRSEVDSSNLADKTGSIGGTWPAISSSSGVRASGSMIQPSGGGVIVQRRDSEDVVRELPPPYADRAGPH
ncbi:hypothetical protein K435DRAFT_965116 [Dendrothele bispora CBS 962.96]|uniref:Uncharacterized protein n=1 Tax=Dendrothele bispora (strain CBS 962.96) TaxID=1314807 RepID=A0A4S8M703_DENBC|nr:hypothetical protein K435DRAFT_965116 [Dendrothele bispora CBS 962.96]